MTLIKLGELIDIGQSDIQSYESVLSDAQINERFQKFASSLRRIAPKADDFLYFSCIFMHSAENSLLNLDGSIKKRADGTPVEARWDIDKKGSWKWICNDQSIRPFKNNNGDIFPESELLKSYKDFVGKPLCVDHKSSSVDAVRDIILDTYYDRKMKRIIGLCALDKVSYPELARKVATGVSCSVSIGVGVKTAICTDCGTMASCEQEFCNHMQKKSGYGEINISLSPIELSLVVNGADPSAKIRTILAHAKNILANTNEDTIDNLSDTDKTSKLNALQDDLKSANEKLAELKDLLEKTPENKPQEITAPYGQTSGRYADPIDETDPNAETLNIPQRFAHNDAYLGELKNLQASIEARLSNIETAMNKTNYNKEDTMSDRELNKEGYFQGGGGVNEPTPGKAKYPKDPLNEDLREHDDKQMVGQKPFPDVGDVDGLHPSPASVDVKDELQRKKMLARAERRQAALIKAKENIMNAKTAYWQGAGGVNEPAPHKVKYPKDPLNEQLRDHEDKQMVGQKPFPDVGAVDGLHPSPASAEPKDELARKKLLQRASLKARFVRTANVDGTENLGSSNWQVFAKGDDGEKLIFTASVDEITGGRTEALYDTVATKDFGSKMLEKIRAVGVSNATKLYKKAQATTMPGTQPGAPADAGGPAAMPPADLGALPPPGDAPTGPAPEDKGGDGDPKEAAIHLAEQARDATSDLLEKVRELTGEQSEMGDLEEGLDQLPKAASASLRPLTKMRKQLNGALISGMKKSIAELKNVYHELKMIASMTDGELAVNPAYAETIIEDALTDAKKAIADAAGLKRAFAKYAKGTEGLLKKAEEAEFGLLATADEDENDARKKAKEKDKSKSKSKSNKEDKKEDKKSDEDEDCMDADDFMNAIDTNDHGLVNDADQPEDEDLDQDHHHPRHPHRHDLAEPDDAMGSHPDLRDEHSDSLFDVLDDGTDSDPDFADLSSETEMSGHDSTADLSDHDLDMGEEMHEDANDVMMDVDIKPKGNMGGGTVSTAALDLTTKAGRTAYRAKLARDATGKEDNGEVQSVQQYSDMLDQADRLADGQTHLDTKPSDNLGRVETLPEVQDKMLEVAKMPPKVRKEAERLNQLITEGKVDSGNLDALVSQGLDPEVVKYWRQYWGEAGKEGSEFAKMLTTETFKAKMAEEQASYRVKIARAFEFAYDMVKCGMAPDNRAAVNAQVDEIMKWNDEAFDSMKRVVAKYNSAQIQKQASSIPMVGMRNSFQDETQVVQPQVDFQSELDRAFSGRKY